MPARELDRARQAGFDGELRETVYWVALLRFIGCTGHAHEVATLFGDEIAIRGQTLVHDSGNPAEVMRDIVAFATAGRSRGGARRDRPEDPGDDPRVGVLQLLVRVRGGRRARRSGWTSARPFARRSASRSSAGTGTDTRTTQRARRSRSRCASCTSAMTWRRSGGSSRPTARSRPRTSAATRRTTRRVADLFLEHGAAWFDRLGRDRAVGRRARPRARAPPPADRRRAGRRPRRRRRLHRPQVAVLGRAQPPLRGAGGRRGRRARARRGGRDDAPPRSAGARLRHHGRAELDLGQARPADTGGVRPGRAAPDGDRADAAPLTGARRPEPGRLRAPREMRRVGIPQAAAG